MIEVFAPHATRKEIDVYARIPEMIMIALPNAKPEVASTRGSESIPAPRAVVVRARIDPRTEPGPSSEKPREKNGSVDLNHKVICKCKMRNMVEYVTWLWVDNDRLQKRK